MIFGALGFVGACALLLTAWFALVVAGDRVMPGVRLENMDVSRLTRAEVVTRVQGWAAERGARAIAAKVAGTSLSFEPQKVGFRVDAEASAARALMAGRYDGLPRRFLDFLTRLLRPARVEAVFVLDPKLLSDQFDEWEERAIDNPPFAGGIAVDGVTVTPLYPRSGARLDRPMSELALRNAIRGVATAGSVPTHSEAPAVTPAEVDRVVSRVKGMLSAEVVLTAADQVRRLQLSPAQVASVLRVTPGATKDQLVLSCAPDAVHGLLEPHRAEFEQAPQDARFVIDARDHVLVEAGHAGVVVDDQAVALAVCAAAETADKKGVLPLAAGADPKLSTETAEHAGIAGLMGTYTTRHACCQPRVENIHHIADLLEGTLVRPGETFSVNQLVGPRTVKNGFRPAPSIEDGDMVDTVGGGVSQFATTLFNALFYGGYDILERQPHSYWFTRYPMGYDATLSYPHPDIVFKNDTDACALIKTSYTDTSITVKVYGDNGGRRVRAEVSERQNIVTPPVEFIPNPRLDADEEKTREGGMIGWTVTVKRTITFADGKTKEERRKVTYRPRARRVEVHPCRIPAGEPGHTGERCPVPEKDPEGDSAPTDASAK